MYVFKKISDFTDNSTPNNGAYFLLEDVDGNYYKITKSQLSSVIGNSISLQDVKGIIYNKNTWSNITDFSTNGASIALNGSYLDLSGGTGTFTKSVDLNNPSQLDKWKIETSFSVASAVSGANYGMGIGKRSVNANPFNLLARIETWHSPATLFISANGVDIATSVSSLPVTLGAIINLSIARNGYNVVATASNGVDSISVSYDFSTTYGTTAFLDNTGKYALYSFGGTQTIQKLIVSSSEQINNELMIVGDSKVQGYYLSREFNRLNNLFDNTTINSGGNDTTVEVLARISEIIALNPKKVILSIGSNDVRYGRSLSAIQTDYTSITTQLTTAGIEVYHMVPPETILISLESWIRSTYSANYISFVWDCLSDSDGSLKTIYDSGDAVHINDLAVRVISNCILNSGFFNTIYSKLSNNRIASLSDIPSITGKEDTSNKSSSYTASSTTTYANTKALVDGLVTKLSLSGGSLTGAINEAKSSNIAGGTTIDLSTSTGNLVHITGSSWACTSLGTLQAGTERRLIFDGSGTLTYNATSLILPGASSIVTQAGDSALFVSEGSGNWKCMFYQSAAASIGTWSPSWTGFSANPTVSVADYQLIGDVCTVWLTINASGTSNATTCTVTLPFAAKYGNVRSIQPIINNSAPTTGLILTTASSNVLTGYATPATGAWTATGGKFIYLDGFSYRIA